jgi:small GTP-binding protein
MKKFQGKQHSLHLLDTCGSDLDYSFRVIYPICDVFLVCFSLNDRETLNNIPLIWFPYIKKFASNAPILLVGTKSDLWKPGEDNHTLPAQIDQVFQQVKAFKFIECSAKKNENVNRVFDFVIQAFLQKALQNKNKCFTFF